MRAGVGRSSSMSSGGRPSLRSARKRRHEAVAGGVPGDRGRAALLEVAEAQVQQAVGEHVRPLLGAAPRRFGWTWIVAVAGSPPPSRSAGSGVALAGGRCGTRTAAARRSDGAAHRLDAPLEGLGGGIRALAAAARAYGPCLRSTRRGRSRTISTMNQPGSASPSPSSGDHHLRHLQADRRQLLDQRLGPVRQLAVVLAPAPRSCGQLLDELGAERLGEEVEHVAVLGRVRPAHIALEDRARAGTCCAACLTNALNCAGVVRARGSRRPAPPASRRRARRRTRAGRR